VAVFEPVVTAITDRSLGHSSIKHRSGLLQVSRADQAATSFHAGQAVTKRQPPLLLQGGRWPWVARNTDPARPAATADPPWTDDELAPGRDPAGERRMIRGAGRIHGPLRLQIIGLSSS